MFIFHLSQINYPDFLINSAYLRSYYDEKTQWNIQMEAQKMQIHDLEQAIIQTKKTYKDAMLNLSKISEEVNLQH